MKVDNDYLEILREQATELIELGNSHERYEGYGMMRVIKSIEEMKPKRKPWFFGAEKILKDGYWYVKIKDIIW